MEKEPFEFRKFLFGSIKRKLTFLFLVVGIAAPAVGIYYFYSISVSLLSEGTEIYYQQSILLQIAAVLIIVLIALDAAIIGFLISRSISKPLNQLYRATQEIQKGNFDGFYFRRI